MELLAIRLGGKAAKSLVIPEGEGCKPFSRREKGWDEGALATETSIGLAGLTLLPRQARLAPAAPRVALLVVVGVALEAFQHVVAVAKAGACGQRRRRV